MSDTAKLEVNGQIIEYAGGSMPGTVADLAKTLGLDMAMIVAEVNGEIIRRNDAAKHILAAGDRIELVRFVGGG